MVAQLVVRSAYCPLFLIDSSIAAQGKATTALPGLVFALRGIPTEQQSDVPPRADSNRFH